MIDAHRLRVLVALAETGTLSAAAARLHFSQSTVSHHLSRLESESGAVLVQPVGRRLQLTAEGRHLVERGAPILAALDQTERELRAMTALEAGVVRLAAFPSAVATLIPRLLDTVSRTAPGLRIDVVDAEPPIAGELLVTGAVDVALTFTYDEGSDADFHHTPVMQDPLTLVEPMTPHDGPDTVVDLAAHAESVWIAGCQRCRSHLLAACARAGFHPTIGYTSDDYVAVQALVATGQGVTLLPRMALDAHTHPDVRVRPVPDETRTIRISTTAAAPRTPAMTLVLRELNTLFD